MSDYIYAQNTFVVDGVEVTNRSDVMVDVEEAKLYIEYLEKKHQKHLQKLAIRIDGEEVDLTYNFVPVPFERIRRITGYITGDMSTWNSAKRAEAKDRVKHNVKMEVI